jgi:putative tryptophan/tyrosine transport system substrate-binding protein
MDRRALISSAACSVIAATPLFANGQRAPLPLIGFLSSRSPDESAGHAAAFRRGLGESGFVDRDNVVIEYRWAKGEYGRLPGLASALARLKVDVLIAVGGTPSALAAKAAAGSTPIVFLIGEDPVKLGLIASLNRPSRNLTGVTFVTTELGAKRLEALYELVPNASMGAFLLNPHFEDAAPVAAAMQAAARSLGRRLLVVQASTESQIAASFAMLRRERVGALVVQNDAFFDSQRNQLVSLASRNSIPAIYHIREFPAAGGLMSYGASLADAYRQVGIYAGRILKGASPGELPVEQPTRFEMVINVQTAKALGITVPQSMLLRADEVIQ